MLWLLIIFIFVLKDATSIKLDLLHNIMDIDYNLQSTSKLRNLTYFLPLVKLCFGMPESQCFNLAIQTSYAFTILEDSLSENIRFDKQYHESPSSEVVGSTLLSIYKGQHKAKCKNMIDIAYFNNETITNLKHYFLSMSMGDSKSKVMFDGYLGLQKEYKSNNPMSDYHYAFISYLYNRTRLITRPNYSVHYDYYNGGSIAFGEDNGVYTKCKANEQETKSLSYWNCDISDILLGSKSIFIKKQIVELDSGSSLITVPYQEGMIILNYISSLFEGSCSLESESTYSFLVCERDIDIDRIDEITLIMGELAWRFKWKYLFKASTDNDRQVYMTTLIADRSEFLSKDNTWIVGVPGFIGNKIIFDYSDASVGVIQDASRELGKKRSSDCVLYVSLMIVLFGGIIFLVYNRFKLIKRINA